MKSRIYFTLGYGIFIAIFVTICGHLGVTPNYADGNLTDHAITIGIWTAVGFWTGTNAND